MQIVRDLAGYTMGRSDNVRRAMAKKKQSVMEYERNIFIFGNAAEREKEMAEGKTPSPEVPGCVAKGISEAVANKIFDSMMDFASYAFNKSHAACYAVVAYQTAWLKYYYPKEYMAALITSVMDKSGKVAEYIQITKAMGVDVLPPDVNESDVVFKVSGGGIRYALTAIAGVGADVVKRLVAERTAGGPFTDLRDFVERLIEQGINTRQVENFIKAGAFDSIGGTRKQMMCVYNSLMDEVQNERKKSMAGQLSLFEIMDGGKPAFTYPASVGEYDKETILNFEKEVLGLYVSGHPLEEYEALWEKTITTKTTDLYLDEETETTIAEDGQNVSMAGLVTDVRVKYTSRGDRMAYVVLEDLYGVAEVVVFPKTYNKTIQYLEKDAKVVVKGRIQTNDNKDAKLLLENAMPLDSLPKTLWICIDVDESFDHKRSEIWKGLGLASGKDAAKLVYRQKDGTKKVENYPAKIQADDALIQFAVKQVGKDNVILKY